MLIGNLLDRGTVEIMVPGDIATIDGHSDSATEIEALRLLRNRKEIGPTAVEKILCHNPARLYGLA